MDINKRDESSSGLHALKSRAGVSKSKAPRGCAGNFKEWNGQRGGGLERVQTLTGPELLSSITQFEKASLELFFFNVKFLLILFIFFFICILRRWNKKLEWEDLAKDPWRSWLADQKGVIGGSFLLPRIASGEWFNRMGEVEGGLWSQVACSNKAVSNCEIPCGLKYVLTWRQSCLIFASDWVITPRG